MTEILIVDDDRKIRDLLAHMLGAEGYAINQAADSESALSVLKQKQIAVVTVDKDMPGQDGMWLVEQIQAAHPSVAMLLATGDDQIAPRVSLSHGVLGYLVKPFKRELVVGAVKDAVAWHTAAVKQQSAKKGDVNPVDAWLQGRAGRPPKAEE